ncbi:MAG: PAS domain S-box protein [Rhodospirillaceae bacterium]
MTGTNAEKLGHGLKRSALWADAAAAVLAALGFIGGLAGLEGLSAYVVGWPVTTPAVALCLLVVTGALAALQRGAERLRPYALTLIAAIAAVILALMIVPGADRLPGTNVPVYVGITTLLLLAAIGFAHGAQATRPAHVLAVSAAGLLYIALIGTSFRLLMEGPPLMQVSLPSLVIVSLLVYSTLAGRADVALIEKLTSQRPGSVITRQLLPAILALPLLLGWMRLIGQRLGLFDAAFGALLLTVLTVLVLGMLVLWGAETVDQLDARRNEAEHRATAQREWLRVTLTSCTDAVVATDPEGRVRFVNPAAELLIGRAENLLVGRPVQEAVPVADESDALVPHPLLDVLGKQSGTYGYRELVLPQEKQGRRYVEVSAAPIHDENQTLLGGVMVMRDVSVRRQNEQALRAAYAELDQRVAERTAALEHANAALHESLALFRGVAESTPDLIVVKDRQGRLVMANPATIKLIGKPESEILGRTDRDYIADEAAAEQVMENDRRVMTSGRVERVEEVLHTPEGQRTYLSTKSPLRDVNGNVVGIIGVATDITERKRMENELREAQRFTQGLLETAPIILYLFDPTQRRVVYARGMGLAGLGYTPADLLKTEPAELLRMVHPDDVPRLEAHLHEYDRPSDGLREIEFRCRHHHGEWRWLQTRERLFQPGEGGNLVLGVAVDITDRKRAELERERLMAVEQRLRLDAERANRAKDEFLAIVSHELRSPLNALRGWGFLLSNARPLDPTLIERATSAIKRNVDHQARLIDDLLDTSRIMSGKLTIERRPLNLAEVVTGALEVVRPSALAKRIGMQMHGATDPIAIEGDAARLHQVLVNLLSNAVKFTPEGGRITVATRVHEGRAEIMVSDTGAGIDPEFLPRVFDRFSQADTSTTRKHGGLGIGLALVRHLTELHGGRVRAESEGPGKGATFTVDLPLPEPEAVSDAGPHVEIRTVAESSLAGVRIFSLDDDPDARDIISLTLKQTGAEVKTLATGSELLALLEERLPADPPDVLLLDLAMPDEDGFAVLAKVRALEQRKGMPADASIPAIAVTAFTELNRARVTERGFADHVNKPIDAARLIGSIRSATQAKLASHRAIDGEG